MLIVQVVPRAGQDAYKLLRTKVIHEAKTWDWANRKKTRLTHKQKERGHVEVSSAKGVLVAHIQSKNPADAFFLVEKFVGRLVAWFENELAAINLQFLPEAPARKRRRRKR
jgi:hypothetical protein